MADSGMQGGNADRGGLVALAWFASVLLRRLAFDLRPAVVGWMRGCVWLEAWREGVRYSSIGRAGVRFVVAPRLSNF